MAMIERLSGNRMHPQFKCSNLEISCCHIVGSLHRVAGGPAYTVGELASSLSDVGAAVTLVTRYNNKIFGSVIDPRSPSVNVYRAKMWRGVLPRTFISPGFSRLCCSASTENRVQIIHDHGLWELSNITAFSVAKKLSIPLVISPRGMAEPWSIRHKAIRKKVAWLVYQQRVMQSAALFFATSTMEAESLRTLGLRQPIAVIPNGVDLPTANIKRKRTQCSGKILFLSRINPKKGLLELVEAWSKVRRAGWSILIAGPDEDHYRSVVEKHISSFGLQADFQFLGPVEGDVKARLLMSSDLLILPTHSENFGVVVAEALAYRLPVITTTGAPWSDLAEYKCGWWVSPAVEGISTALTAFMNTEPTELDAMGERGRALVTTKYAWNSVARQTLEVYRWIIEPTPVVPSCVQLA